MDDVILVTVYDHEVLPSVEDIDVCSWFISMVDWKDQVAWSAALAELVSVCCISDSLSPFVWCHWRYLARIHTSYPGECTWVRSSGLSGWSVRLHSACPLARLSTILSMSFCLYNKKNITWLQRLEDSMNFIFSWQKQYFTHLCFRKILFCLSKIKSVSLHHRVIPSQALLLKKYS